MSVSCCAAPFPILRTPHVGTAARHRRPRTAAARIGLAVDVLARLGSLVTLVALLVLAGAVGGMFDGVPAGPATVTATFGGAGH